MSSKLEEYWHSFLTESSDPKLSQLVPDSPKPKEETKPLEVDVKPEVKPEVKEEEERVEVKQEPKEEEFRRRLGEGLGFTNLEYFKPYKHAGYSQ